MSENLLKQILDKVNGIEGKVDRLSKDMDIIKADVGTLKEEVSTLKSDVSTLKSDVNILKSDVKTLKSEVQIIKEEQMRHGDLLHQLITNIGSVGKRQDELEKKVEAYYDHHNKAQLSLKKDIEFVYQEVAQNKLEISRLKQSVSL
jgi:outer membrane murein-binding lipoprotein Lpp